MPAARVAWILHTWKGDGVSTSGNALWPEVDPEEWALGLLCEAGGQAGQVNQDVELLFSLRSRLDRTPRAGTLRCSQAGIDFVSVQRVRNPRLGGNGT